MAKKELRSVIAKYKRSYRDNIEEQLHDGDARNVWRRLRNTIGMNEKVKDGVLLINIPNSKVADELGDFYNRFDVLGKRAKCETVCEHIDAQARDILLICESDVMNCFWGWSIKKACNANGIKSCV